MLNVKIGSLFAGIGGIDLGFEQAGFTSIWANENDPAACKTYRENFPNTKLFETDVQNLDVKQLEKVDVLTAGFPCQPFSVCGLKQGFEDKRCNLFFEIMRIVDVLQCSVIFLENVANLLEHDNGKTFQIIYNELSSRNYYVRYLVADACNYGLPQHRTRIYIVAFKSLEWCNNYVFPVQMPLKKLLFDVIDKSRKADDRYYLSIDSKKYKQLSEAIIDDNQIYRFSDYGIQNGKDGISFTLKANMGTWYNRVPYIKDHYGIRQITPYECLALQGFPEKFRFPKIGLKNAYKQSGNTVCVPIIKMLAENLLKYYKT